MLPRHTLTGYWHNFVNGSSNLRLRDVPATYDVVDGRLRQRDQPPGAVSFTVDPQLSSALGGYTDADFTADVRAARRGARRSCCPSAVSSARSRSNDAAARPTSQRSVRSVMTRYGFDGVDIDLENGVNATFMGQALQQLAAATGAGFIITLAPQTIDMQSTGRGYFQLALASKDILTIVNTQYYNSGTMLGCDGRVYAQGTVDFLTALACIQLQGGLRPDQVGLGLPASSRAAGGGAVAPSVVEQRPGLPGPGRRLRLLPAADDVAGDPRRDDVVDQLGPGAGVRVREHRGAGARPAAVAGLRGGAARRRPTPYRTAAQGMGRPSGPFRR